MSESTSARLVAVFDDPRSARTAVDQLANTLRHDQISIQAGDDRAMAAGLRRRAEPGPTHPAEARSRFPLTLGVTLLGAVVGAIVGGLVFLPFEVDVLPRWGEIAVFAVIGAIAGATYAFVMTGGSGPRPGRETEEGAGQIITLSVPDHPDNHEALRRTFADNGAVRIEQTQVHDSDGRAHH